MGNGFDLGASLGGSILNGAFGLIGMKKQQKYQLEQMQKQDEYQRGQMALQNDYQLQQMAIQNDYATQAWERENEYNNPSAVRARYEAAGISPQAALGGGASGSGLAGSLDSGSIPSGPSPGGNSALGVQNGFQVDLLDGLKTAAELMNTRSTMKKQAAEERLTIANAAWQEFTNTLSPIYEEIKKAEADNAKSSAAITEIDRQFEQLIKEKDLEIKDKLLAEFVAKIDNLKSSTDLNKEQKQNLIKMRDVMETQQYYMKSLANEAFQRARKTSTERQYLEQTFTTRMAQEMQNLNLSSSQENWILNQIKHTNWSETFSEQELNKRVEMFDKELRQRVKEFHWKIADDVIDHIVNLYSINMQTGASLFSSIMK